jgi:hypothetical protein
MSQPLSELYCLRRSWFLRQSTALELSTTQLLLLYLQLAVMVQFLSLIFMDYFLGMKLYSKVRLLPLQWRSMLVEMEGLVIATIQPNKLLKVDLSLPIILQIPVILGLIHQISNITHLLKTSLCVKFALKLDI